MKPNASTAWGSDENTFSRAWRRLVAGDVLATKV